MPHCVISYARELETCVSAEELMTVVHGCAIKSGLFNETAIKTRAQCFDHFTSSNEGQRFIHVEMRILSGRTQEQRRALTHRVLEGLEHLKLSSISLTVEVCDMDKGTYAKTVI